MNGHTIAKVTIMVDTPPNDDPENYLEPGEFIDSSHPAIVEFAKKAVGDADTDLDKALKLFYPIRDEITYTPYANFDSPETFMASFVVTSGIGFCVSKAATLAATARASNIPARVGYADVRNHLATPRLLELLETDLFIWHGYSELYLEGKWVKATPAFNRTLCEKFGVKTLDFDGRNDSLFHPFDKNNRRHMEYVQDRGPYGDVPYQTIRTEFRNAYPKLFAEEGGAGGDFQAEAETT